MTKFWGLRASGKTTLADVDAIAEHLGLNASTPENRQWWEQKFKAGVAAYWCPKCGYAGNAEFTKGTYVSGRSSMVLCHLGKGRLNDAERVSACHLRSSGCRSVRRGGRGPAG